MKEIINYSHYRYWQLMKLKRDKLREVFASCSIPFTGRTLKENLARNIAKYISQQIHNPYEVKTN